MGWPKTKKKTYVSSVVYNLAGDGTAKNKGVIPSAILKAVHTNQSIPGNILSNIISGVSANLRRYNTWAYKLGGYASFIGFSGSTIEKVDNIPLSVLEDEVPQTSGAIVQITIADIGLADFTIWANQYVATHRPSELLTDFDVNMNNSTGEIIITYEDNTSATFIPSGFDLSKRYLYVVYNEAFGTVTGTPVVGPTTYISHSTPFPSTSGWTNQSTNNSTTAETLTDTVVTEISYSSGSPAGSTTTTTITSIENCDVINEVWLKEELLASPTNQDILVNRYSTMTLLQDYTVESSTTVGTTSEDVGGGNIKTTTITTTIEQVSYTKSYQVTVREDTIKSWGPTTFYIYQENSGNSTLDALFPDNTNTGGFYPVIPFRLNNSQVSGTLLDQSKKAVKKAIGKKYSDILDKIEDNPSIGDIDYAYLVFGVSLNTKNKYCQRYLYTFFETILDNYTTLGASAFDQFLADTAAAKASVEAWQYWWTQGRAYQSTHDEPVKLPYPTPPLNKIKLGGSAGYGMQYYVEIHFSFITKETGTGLLTPTAKKNSYWVSDGGVFSVVIGQRTRFGTRDVTQSYSITYINHQITATTWERLKIVGLVHHNLVYAGMFTSTSATAALNDPDESGFIIPFHTATVDKVGAATFANMAGSCSYLVFNCYEVVKTKWYQNKVFQVLVSFVIGALTGGVAGVLLVAGGALLGEVTNSKLFNKIMAIFEDVTVSIFGTDIGQGIAIILNLYVGRIHPAIYNNSNALIFAGLVNPALLLGSIDAVGNGYYGYAAAATQQELAQFQIEAAKEQALFKQKSEELYGKGPAAFDITVLREASVAYAESSSIFLSRTLMTGGDVVDATLGMVANFTKFSLSTDIR